MADAGAGGDDIDGGGADAGADETLAASGNQQVNITIGSHQGGGAFPGGVLHQIHRILCDAHRFQTGTQGVDDGIGAAEGFLAAPENADIAALQSQSCRIGGDIGPAFVNNSDDAHGNGGFLNH